MCFGVSLHKLDLSFVRAPLFYLVENGAERVCDLQSHLLPSSAFTKLLLNLRDFTGIDSGMGAPGFCSRSGSGDFQALSQIYPRREFSFNDLTQLSDCSAGQLDMQCKWP